MDCMNDIEAKKLVEEKLPKKRFDHSVRVAETAVKMAEIFNADKEKSYLAGVLHDYCKYDNDDDMKQIIKEAAFSDEYLDYDNAILHGPAAAALMKKEFYINDEEILIAIKNHTSGRAHMDLIEKIIFVADYIEPGRDIPGVEDIRSIIFKEEHLDRAVYEISKRNISFLVSRNVKIFSETFKCYNYYN